MLALRYWILHCVAFLLIARAFIPPVDVDLMVLGWLGVPHTAESVARSFFLLYWGIQGALLIFALFFIPATLVERWRGTTPRLSTTIETSFVWLWNHIGVSLLKGFFYVVSGVWLYFIVVAFYVLFRLIPISGVLDFIVERFGSTVGYGFAAMLFLDSARHWRWSDRWLAAILGHTKKGK
ncbi:hypothetical protein HZA86_04575 [Candidatus Uhrbacteria bacterium]|nr:hypothetical protein [Candidatus Uhrbacteria bacterium]